MSQPESPIDLHPALASTWPLSEKPLRLKVTNSAAASLHRGAPWLYAEKIIENSSTDATDNEGSPGDLAVVYDNKRNFVAIGLYDPTSPIRMRVLRHSKGGPIDAPFFTERIERALARRKSLAATDTNGYRMIHGESDGFPGLVADRYADTGVIKLYTPAWLPYLHTIITALLAAQPLSRLILRLSRGVQQNPQWLNGLEDGDLIAGPPLNDEGLVIMRENGLLIEVDPVRGQKTGFFLDQRDNRARVEAMSKGKRVLNVFSYNGGFSLAAARGGASEVTSLDLSPHALHSAERNFTLNRDNATIAAATHKTIVGDAFAEMAALARAENLYDIVVVDPPAFAARRSQVPEALKAYGRLTHLALMLLEPDGDIVLASCSNPVTPEDFRTTVLDAAQRAGRPLQIVEETGHAIDHPLDFAESRYLKCIFAKG